MRDESQTTNQRAHASGWRAVLAVCALVFALTAIGCGSGEDSSGTQSTAASSSSPAADTTAAQSGDSGGSEAAAGGDTVDIVDFDYDPKTIAVDAGSSVEFVNKDTAAHTATADDSSFDTGTLNKGDTAKVTFDKPGSFTYYCRFHAFMKATVEVK